MDTVLQLKHSLESDNMVEHHLALQNKTLIYLPSAIIAACAQSGGLASIIDTLRSLAII